MQLHKVIKSVINTEKTSRLKQSENKYTFEVDRKANKIEIRRALEKLYKVKVVNVNTTAMHGKKRNMRGQMGYQPDWKKAVVSLRVGDRIEVLE